MTATIVSQDYKQLEQKVAAGLGFILDHLKEPLWPRTISTKTTEGIQIPVKNEQEALAWYKAANFLDCRINAYSYYYRKEDVRLRRMIDLVMIDLDQCNFKSSQELDRARNKTFKKTQETFGSHFTPSEVWSGNGYHIYIPIESRYILEEKIQFSRFKEPSKQFLRFAEYYLSNGKADSNHVSNVSFGNCMLRIPGSHNSKCLARSVNTVDYSSEVRIVKKWNGYRPPFYLLSGSFLAYLLDQKREEEARIIIRFPNGNEYSKTTTIPWIEKGILQNPIRDHRKYSIWRILSSYLINVRRLSYEESFNIMKDWLDNCNNLERLSFNAKSKIKESLIRVGSYRPISLDDPLKSPNNLKMNNRKLYDIVRSRYDSMHRPQSNR